MMAYDPNDAGLTRIIMQSAGGWYFDKDGNLAIEGNVALKAALEVIQKIQTANIFRPAAGWADWVGAFTGGEVASVTTGVWITGTVKSQPEQSGNWGIAPIPKLTIEGATHYSNLGGSSWYVLSASAAKDEAADFLNEIYAKDVNFYQKILVDRGAVGSLLAAREGEAYKSNDAFFGGEPIWQTFSDWLSKVPSVNYGTFTNEVDSVVAAHQPELAKGTPVDDVIKAINEQAQTLVQ
ncbi:MAG: lacE [Proteobacteria bacterium]|nr:lacE [Pseudomonadota bacterium]